MELITLLQWRYATKKMTGKKIQQDKIERILEAIRLAPSSNGLQPFEILVISNPEIKQQIASISRNQPQIISCSHLVVFAVWDQYSEARIDAYINHMVKERGVSRELLDNFRLSLINNFVSLPESLSIAHAARQAYIALGVAIIAAAAEGIDSSPMEGFDPEKLDNVLGLSKKGLRSVVLLALGYRDAENDWLVKLPKVRRHREQLITEIP